MFNSKKNFKCRICDNKKLFTYLDLGRQPPSNSFIKSKKTKESFFPLKVQLCEKCGLSQLDTIVSAKNIFDEGYEQAYEYSGMERFINFDIRKTF